MPALQGLFCFLSCDRCSRPTQYSWEDEEGVRHQIRQRVGREQGDPPMPLLFRLGIHNDGQVHAQMTEQSTSSSFWTTCMSRQIRNEFVSCTNCRPRPCIAEPGSVRTQTTTRTWNQGGKIPTNIEELGRRFLCPEGSKILRTPVASEALPTEVQRTPSQSRKDTLGRHFVCS